ncbi:MAG: peptidoglycan-binding protein, partial [Candidatus Yonathbacteria bacterium]|nr:peptidoglycan-binding protein [Candidatus Yonathbacteria bacterium]
MQKLLLTLILALSLPLFVSATTTSDLESRIAALLAQIQTLQTELQSVKTTEEASSASSVVFTTTLGKGSGGADVTALQTYLAKDPSLYPEGTISGYYGSLTESAVKRFQAKHSIVSSGTPLTTGYGVLGPKTRATLNALLATPSSTPTTPTPTPTP